MKKAIFIYPPILCILLVGCFGDRKELNDANPFYQRGLELRQEGNYENAEAAFKKCLQYSPNSFKANFQLALIYEDHFQSYPNAIVHYQTFIQNSSDAEEIALARKWLARAEKKYYQSLQAVYGNERLDLVSVVTNKEREHIPQNKKGNLPPHPIEAATRIIQETFSTNNRGPKEIIQPNPLHDSIEQLLADKKPNDYYVVQDGDTLVKIAHKTLGNKNLWEKIFKLNKDLIKSPELLQIGQKLKIPQQSPGE